MSLPNKDEFQGGATRVVGKIKEEIGRTFDDKSLENEGKAQQVKGSLEEGFGYLKHKAKDAMNQTIADIGDDAKHPGIM